MQTHDPNAQGTDPAPSPPPAPPSPPPTPPTPAPPRPRRAPVYRVFIGAVLVGFLAIGAVYGVTATVLSATGLDAAQIAARFESDALFMLLLMMPMQVVLVTAALLTTQKWARRERVPVAAALGLVRPRLGATGWALVLTATGIPFALAVCAATLVPSMGGAPEKIDAMWKTMPIGIAVAWVLVIGAMPGLCEELFFRGFVQRRLMQRHGPAAAIGITSVLFAILHIDPPAMMLALVLGVWLGYVAWRTGSVLLTVVIHASINSVWNALQIVGRRVDLPEAFWWTVSGVFVVVSLVCFVGAMRLLMRKVPPPVAAGSDSPRVR
ncbi:MAG: type II CAAX prenyl endopeptidase Rce1 family protein [Phycisphaerales bacterium]